jgi:hypothetical protein
LSARLSQCASTPVTRMHGARSFRENKNSPSLVLVVLGRHQLEPKLESQSLDFRCVKREQVMHCLHHRFAIVVRLELRIRRPDGEPDGDDFPCVEHFHRAVTVHCGEKLLKAHCPILLARLPNKKASLSVISCGIAAWSTRLIAAGVRPSGGTLLFPSETGGMLKDWRKVLDAVAKRAGWKVGEIRSKRFRHTYCAARLQTLDGGAPISVFTVARELGHSSTDMVEKVYSHLGTIRHRSDAVEYRVEQHEKAAR